MVDPKTKTLGETLRRNGVSRRGFLKFCTATASMMALPPSMVPAIAAALDKARRPSVIWLSFQECTGCTESLTRSHSPTLENLIFDHISLDYHHTLQAASGHAAEAAREAGDACQRGQLSGGRGRIHPTGESGLLDHGRFQQSADTGRDGRRRGSGHSGGHLRRFRRTAQGRSQSHRRGFGEGYHYRQTGNQRIGMSPDSGRDHRCPGALSYLRNAA